MAAAFLLYWLHTRCMDSLSLSSAVYLTKKKRAPMSLYYTNLTKNSTNYSLFAGFNYKLRFNCCCCLCSQRLRFVSSENFLRTHWTQHNDFVVWKGSQNAESEIRCSHYMRTRAQNRMLSAMSLERSKHKRCKRFRVCLSLAFCMCMCMCMSVAT